MKKFLVALALFGSLLAVPAPASASGLACGAAKPVAVSGNKWNLLNTYKGAYTGKPFSFKLTIQWLDASVGGTKVYTLVPTGRSFLAGPTHYGYATKVETWLSGTRCSVVWNGAVHSA